MNIVFAKTTHTINTVIHRNFVTATVNHTVITNSTNYVRFHVNTNNSLRPATACGFDAFCGVRFKGLMRSQVHTIFLMANSRNIAKLIWNKTDNSWTLPDGKWSAPPHWIWSVRGRINFVVMVYFQISLCPAVDIKFSFQMLRLVTGARENVQRALLNGALRMPIDYPNSEDNETQKAILQVADMNKN